MIVPKHVIAKAFIVHPSTTSVFEASSKYQWLTKTKLFEGLPAPFSNVDNFLDDKEYEHLREKFKESILQNHAFRKEGISANHRFRRRGEEMTMGFLQDLLRFGWSLSDRHRHLDDCFLDLKPKMRIHWARHHNFYQLDQEPAFVIRTKQPSQLLEPNVEKTSLETIPGPFDNYSINVFRHPILHLQNKPGFQNSAFYKYPYNHAMFLTNINKLTYDQQQAYGIMSMFGSLVALAMDYGVQMGQHLQKPLVTKCVITDGIQCTLMCYQLNTLSFQEDFGIKNFAWVSHSMNLFEVTNAKHKPLLFETLDVDNKVCGFNDECFKTVLAFLCKETES